MNHYKRKQCKLLNEYKKERDKQVENHNAYVALKDYEKANNALLVANYFAIACNEPIY